MKNDNSTEQSNASKPMLANRLNAHECYKIKIEKKLTDKEYKNLLIENGIIIKKQFPEKLYFLDIDDTNCYPLSDRLNDARLEGLEKVTLVEAIPDNDNVDFVWCSHYGEVSDRDQCKKSFCPHYESKSGRGVCKHRGNLYTHGDEVTFDVPTQAVC